MSAKKNAAQPVTTPKQPEPEERPAKNRRAVPSSSAQSAEKKPPVIRTHTATPKRLYFLAISVTPKTGHDSGVAGAKAHAAEND